MTDDDLDLDQVFTSAMAAVAFTIMHWDHFAAWLAPQLSEARVPVTRDGMRAAGIRIAEMVDPARLAE